MIQAREILRSSARWTRGEWGLTAEGNSVPDKSDPSMYGKVCKVCAEGAIICAAKTYDVALDAIKEVDKEAKLQSRFNNVLALNDGMDEDGGGRKATVKAFTATIRRLRAALKQS